MWNKVLLVLIFFSISLFGQEIDPENPIIVWEEISHANGYQVQIKDKDEEIILEKNVTGNSYKLKLEPGRYSHRVGSYNKFGKISSYSKWIEFEISKSFAPEILGEKQIIKSKKEKEVIIKIQGKNFYEDTFVSLSNELGNVAITKMKMQNQTFELTIDNENTREGDYDLVLENPRKKLLIVKKYYVLKPESFFSTEKPSTDNMQYPYWKEAARSAILPGWGQIRKDQTKSAIFWDLGIILSAGNLYAQLHSFKEAKNNYNQSISRSILYQIVDGKELVTFYGLLANEKQFSQANSASISVFNASILLASFYTLNILDALLWKITSKTSVSSGLKIYSKFQSFPMANPVYSNYPSNFELGIQFNF